MEQLKESYQQFLTEFITDLSKAFPKNKEIQACDKIKDKIKSDMHINYLSKKVADFKQEFINQDDKIFDKPCHLIPTVDFSIIWKEASAENKTVIWKYLQTLYLISCQVNMQQDKANKNEKKEETNQFETSAMAEMQKIIDNIKEAGEKQQAEQDQQSEQAAGNPFNIEDILGGSANPVAGKMNDLVKNLAGSLSQQGGSPMDILKNPNGIKDLFSKVEKEVQSLCEDEKFQESDLENYAENIKSNLQNKLNIPLDSLMQNLQGMMGNQKF
jgi:predicted nuclease with TOPRIM domain